MERGATEKLQMRFTTGPAGLQTHTVDNKNAQHKLISSILC